MTNEGASQQNRRTKVEILLDEYELDGVGQLLETHWSASGSGGDSLRELANFLNERLLETAIRESSMRVVEGEVENYHRLLTSDNVSAGQRTEARSRLEEAGIDVEALLSDFVSHQAVHTYLTDRRGVEHEEKSHDERLAARRESLLRLQSRVETVTKSVIVDADATEVAEPSVLVSVTVSCEECGGQYSPSALLERGGCQCVN
jgi:hypothetical protein